MSPRKWKERKRQSNWKRGWEVVIHPFATPDLRAILRRLSALRAIRSIQIRPVIWIAVIEETSCTVVHDPEIHGRHRRGVLKSDSNQKKDGAAEQDKIEAVSARPRHFWSFHWTANCTRLRRCICLALAR